MARAPSGLPADEESRKVSRCGVDQTQVNARANGIDRHNTATSRTKFDCTRVRESLDLPFAVLVSKVDQREFIGVVFWRTTRNCNQHSHPPDPVRSPAVPFHGKNTHFPGINQT